MVLSALKNRVPQQAKKQVWCMPNRLFSKGKKYTPKSLPGVRGEHLRTAFVYLGCLLVQFQFWAWTVALKKVFFSIFLSIQFEQRHSSLLGS